jgi:Tol biopolymer transport system component
MPRLSSSLVLLMVVPSFWGACAPGLSAADDAAGAGPDDGAGGRVAASGGKSGSEGGSGGKGNASGGKSGGSGGKSASGGAAGADGEPGAGGRASGGDTGTGGGAPTCEDECPKNASCVVEGNSASCECDEGFEAEGEVCVDIDECEEDDPCDENAACENTRGSYECTCEAGFFGDGLRCVPRTRLVSVSLTGEPANFYSTTPALSGDGRFVAFASYARDLVSDDTNNTFDIFVFDDETGKVSRVSVNSAGVEANGSSTNPSLSADGRYVVFDSSANNLVPGDANDLADIFRHDRMTGETIRVNLTNSGAAVTGTETASPYPTVSGDGNLVSFSSSVATLVSGDTNGIIDQFVRDVSAGTTVRVNVANEGGEAAEFSTQACPFISDNGRYVVFASPATALRRGAGTQIDIYRRDLQENVTDRVTYPRPTETMDGDSGAPSVSADGRYVVFESDASTLVAGDTNDARDVFVRDMQIGTIERVSVTNGGGQANGSSYLSCARSISADGRYVVFASSANNLVSGDTNGSMDVFVRDRVSQTTKRVSVGSLGEQAEGSFLGQTISASGKVVAFVSMTDSFGVTPGFDQIWIRHLD